MPISAGSHALAAREHDAAGLQILAGEAPVLPGLARPRRRAIVDAAVALFGVLLHHDRVGARGHHAAGEDAHRLAGADASANGLPANDSPMRFSVVSRPAARSAKRTA